MAIVSLTMQHKLAASPLILPIALLVHTLSSCASIVVSHATNLCRVQRRRRSLTYSSQREQPYQRRRRSLTHSTHRSNRFSGVTAHSHYQFIRRNRTCQYRTAHYVSNTACERDVLLTRIACTWHRRARHVRVLLRFNPSTVLALMGNCTESSRRWQIYWHVVNRCQRRAEPSPGTCNRILPRARRCIWAGSK